MSLRPARSSLAFAALLLVAALVLPACDSGGGDDTMDGPFAEALDNPGDWSWIPVDGAKCRDGSDTGFGVRLQEDSDDFMIYLEGGGACFNNPTCLQNPSSFDRSNFEEGIAGGRGTQGIFNMSNSANPVADWNMVYVPYCTGDVHGGSLTDVSVEGVSSPQQFVGHDNVEQYLGLLGEEFGGTVDQVLLTGVSAGGFGTMINYPDVASTFSGAEVTLMNDSGPLVAPDNVLSPGLQAQWIQLWGLGEVIPADASEVLEKDGFVNIYDYYTETYPDEDFGLISYLQDGTIRQFYSFGQPDGNVPGEEYEAALADVRDDVAPEWGTYYATGDDHTFIVSDFYSTTVNGVPLTDWVASLLNDNPRDVAPAPGATPAPR